MTVWRELVKMAKPQNTEIFGTSTGSNLTLAPVLRAKDEKLPLPGCHGALRTVGGPRPHRRGCA
jgi:acetyl esterase/lipase